MPWLSSLRLRCSAGGMTSLKPDDEGDSDLSCARAFAAVLIVLVAPPVGAEGPALSVTPAFSAGAPVSTADAVMLTLSRPLAAAEGRLAILVGSTDWTDLFTVRGTVATFTPGPIPFPAGATEVTAYLVAPRGEWRELGRFPLTVQPPTATPRVLKPVLDLSFKARLREEHRPESNAPARATYQDLVFQAALEADGSRDERTRKASFKVVGTTCEKEALRAGTLGATAPQVDLAAYGVELGRGRAQLAAGGLTLSVHRHLLNEFETRGTRGTLPMGRAATLTLSAVSGTKVVGWQNPLGVGVPAHRFVTGALAVEVVPSKPGALRLEAGLLDGSVLPLSSYNQGSIEDAAGSRGAGLRLGATTLAGRLRLDGSLARSRSALAFDAGLEAGVTIVPDTVVDADARFARAELDVLKDVAVSPSAPLTLTITAQHERLDPLYRSVGVELQADLQQEVLGAVLALGEGSAQFLHTRGRDNLGDVASLLTTLTRQDALDVSLPLGGLLAGGGPAARFLPQLSYGHARVHQYGAGVPENSDFNASHVPDQMDVSHTAGVQWQGAFSLGYTLTASRQDNRQPGRERADFAHETHQVALGLTRGDHLEASLELQLESGRNEEIGVTDRLRRIGFTLNRRPPRGFGVSAVVGAAWTDAEGADRDGRTLEGDLQASWRLVLRPGRKAPAATFFVRGATQRALVRDPALEVLDDRAAWQLGAGLNLSAF